MTKIDSFRGNFRWLSNFWPCSVVLDGVVYPSVENAYQAAKFHSSARQVFVDVTAGQAKRLARTMCVRNEWESVKISVMTDLIAQKFSRGSHLAEMLLLTGFMEIVEGNTWGDHFWGVCAGRGENRLGRIIMDRRDWLRSHQNDN